MKLLVDTHLLLWSTYSPKVLSRKSQEVLQDPKNELVFSVVSLWEVGVKRALKRPDFNFDPNILRTRLFRLGFSELPLNADHALAVGHLPSLHRDPFDRLLLCQTMVEGISLLTNDKDLKAYPVSVILA